MVETIYLLGAELSALPNFLPQFQIIGGTLEYDQGWTFEPYLGPTQNSQFTPIVMSDLLPGFRETLGDFHPSFSIADLGYITTGVPL